MSRPMTPTQWPVNILKLDRKNTIAATLYMTQRDCNTLQYHCLIREVTNLILLPTEQKISQI